MRTCLYCSELQMTVESKMKEGKEVTVVETDVKTKGKPSYSERVSPALLVITINLFCLSKHI
jgi:hypothetical protein